MGKCIAIVISISMLLPARQCYIILNARSNIIGPLEISRNGVNGVQSSSDYHGILILVSQNFGSHCKILPLLLVV